MSCEVEEIGLQAVLGDGLETSVLGHVLLSKEIFVADRAEQVRWLLVVSLDRLEVVADLSLKKGSECRSGTE